MKKALLFVLSSILTFIPLAASAQDEPIESIPFTDSSVIVEQAPTDYSIYVTLAIGLIVAGFIIYILAKPRKR